MVNNEDIISGTESAYWHSNNTFEKDSSPAFENPDQFWATINKTQKLLKELIDTFEDLKQIKGERSSQNSD
tara:strand:- start:4441 stop:4653 length:213 start_codon:yes stop_codon:yes gene_type:complete